MERRLLDEKDTAGTAVSPSSHVEPGAGHFVWHGAPGCLLAAMDRLVRG